MRKSFKAGLNSLLGETPETKAVEVNNDIPDLSHLRGKRGRPKSNFRNVTSQSQKGTHEGETRATFIMNEELLDQVKAIAYWDRLLIKDTITIALEEHVAKWIKKKGDIKPINKNKK